MKPEVIEQLKNFNRKELSFFVTYKLPSYLNDTKVKLVESMLDAGIKLPTDSELQAVRFEEFKWAYYFRKCCKRCGSEKFMESKVEKFATQKFEGLDGLKGKVRYAKITTCSVCGLTIYDGNNETVWGLKDFIKAGFRRLFYRNSQIESIFDEKDSINADFTIEEVKQTPDGHLVSEFIHRLNIQDEIVEVSYYLRDKRLVHGIYLVKGLVVDYYLKPPRSEEHMGDFDIVEQPLNKYLNFNEEEDILLIVKHRSIKPKDYHLENKLLSVTKWNSLQNTKGEVLYKK